MSKLNQFFAKHLLKDAYTEQRGKFLEGLMQSSREGNLCLEELDAPDFPNDVVGDGSDPKKPVVKQGFRYYLQRNWALETIILEEICRLKKRPKPQMGIMDLNLLPAQKIAVQKAYENAFSIICGGPGTGKTYTATTFIQYLLAREAKTKVVIAAPTGKAASHFVSVLGKQVEATTLHRLLRIKPGESGLQTQWTIDADLVIVDEASMIDVPLLAKLLRSIGNETRLILMGDPDQLPPVEAASLFKELATLFGARLEKSMRTDDQTLGAIAEKVNLGQWGPMPLLPWNFDAQLAEKLFQKIDLEFSVEEPDPMNRLQGFNQFRILGALRQGPFGTDRLNQQILQEMNRRIRPGQWWTVPIMITSNHSEKDLYNGSCGILVGKSRNGQIHLCEGNAYFPQKIPYKMLPPYEIAFCLSIHKSQGSEFDKVLALFPEGSDNFGKEAIYTAVTRAKKTLEIVAKESILKAMLSKHSSKTSGLSDRLTISLTVS